MSDPAIVLEDQLRADKLRDEFESVRMRAAREVVERFGEMLDRQGRVSQTPFARKLVAACAVVKRKHHATRDGDEMKVLADFLQSAAKTVFLAEVLGLGQGGRR